MGTTNENEKQGARETSQPLDYKKKSREMLHDAYCIAASSLSEARKITDTGESKGVPAWMHIAEKAIGEIVRLTPMCGADNITSTYKGKSVGWDYDPEKEAELLALVPD